ncbi:hypothetical protein [Pararhizobium sp.]|uniref:hypothetical protein n=1 Tax=Pararhizobium sp. TaxID=1977563 RepID=UPI0027185D78|nr:hypothetical protein [Pararhizobium sp.]MDO9418018.1 hypothetical protein [Pararhizobium sp.]
MNIMARRLTIISLMLLIFALLLTAAVEADAKRRTHNYQSGTVIGCLKTGTPNCTASL